MKTEYVYVVVNEEGERRPSYGKQTRVFLRESAAKARCPSGYHVVRLKVSEGEVVHEG